MITTGIFCILASEDLQKKVTTACYGTIENFLEPNCPDGSKIAVNSVLYGAKAERRQCPMVTNSDNYSPHCCMQEPGDCVFKLHVNTTYHAHCIGQQRCELQAVWSETKSHCNDGPYHSYTNFMVMAYYCIGGASECSLLTNFNIIQQEIYINMEETENEQNILIIIYIIYGPF